MKRTIGLVFIITIISALLTACSSGGDDIVVVSREDGSGTRGAFIELMGIKEKYADGNTVDRTTDEAIIVNSTSIVMINVSSNENAIGYISLGSLNDTVKALDVEGVEPTIDSIKDGSYKVARPFNIATKGELSEVTKDFIDFILSAEGQLVVEETGYISDGNNGSYNGKKPEGTVAVAGSTSVSPVMEKLKETYEEINPDANIEIQSVGSSAGMQAAIDETADIGMASRELKDSELEVLDKYVIALDGIAVIVNNDNPVDNITSQQVKEIFAGDVISWDDIQ